MMATKVPLAKAWEHYRKTTDHAHGEKHVREVLRLIRPLAKKHGVDKRKAEMAAILHDIGRETERRIPGIDHAVAGADIARHFTDDKEVLDAIRRHRKGSGEMPKTPLDKILWDADLVAGVNHAEERAYQWNRDDGLAPEAARRAARKYLKEQEVESYTPSNAYTPEAKEMLKEELPKLKEKLASVVAENERLKRELRVNTISLPFLPSVQPVVKRIPNYLGVGDANSVILTANPRGFITSYMAGVNRTPELAAESQAYDLHHELLNEKHKQRVLREQYGGQAIRPVKAVKDIVNIPSNVYRNLVGEKLEGFGASTSLQSVAEEASILHKASPEVQKDKSYRDGLRRLMNRLVGNEISYTDPSKLPALKSNADKMSEWSKKVPAPVAALTNLQDLKDPHTYGRAALLAGMAVAGVGNRTRVMGRAKQLLNPLRNFQPGAIAGAALAPVLLYALANKFSEKNAALAAETKKKLLENAIAALRVALPEVRR